MARYNGKTKRRGRNTTRNTYTIVPEQERFLGRVLDLANIPQSDEVVLTERQRFVINKVLKNGTYHDNWKYHLNVIRKKYIHIMDEIS